MIARVRLCLVVLCFCMVSELVSALPREDAHKGGAVQSSGPFGLGDVEQRAKKLASQPFSRDEGDLPDFLAQMDAEHYRDIHFKPEKALWREEHLPFQVQLFHRGYMYKDRVSVNLVDGGQVQPVPYSSDFFDFGQNLFPAAPPPTVSYAGVRFQFPLRKGSEYDEVAVFLGSSSFRAVGMGQVYGTSARGVAVDTGLAKAEETALFKEFWVEKPAPGSDRLIVYALLDSPSATGAFRFVLRPGLATTIDVNSRFYFRKNVERLGIAPLSSMYFHGENTDRFIDDFRPEAHDADGLLMARNSGEWTWRPLNNPRQLHISVLKDANPKGFGLMQRDKYFEHYQDLDAHYQHRPSLWVEPLGGWGAGGVYLIEIPSEAEKYDNIVAFWVSDQPVLKGQERVFDYRLHYLDGTSPEPEGGKVVSSRVGAPSPATSKRRFVVEFSGEQLKHFSESAPIEAELSATTGKLSDVAVIHNDETGGWRLSFLLEPAADKDVSDLRAYLKSGGEVLSETWLYQWSAK